MFWWEILPGKSHGQRSLVGCDLAEAATVGERWWSHWHACDSKLVYKDYKELELTPVKNNWQTKWVAIDECVWMPSWQSRDQGIVTRHSCNSAECELCSGQDWVLHLLWEQTWGIMGAAQSRTQKLMEPRKQLHLLSPSFTLSKIL